MKRKSLCVLAVAFLALACAQEGSGDSAESRMAVNEALAVSHLRSLAAAQTHAQSLAVVDQDEDGLGALFIPNTLALIKGSAHGAAADTWETAAEFPP